MTQDNFFADLKASGNIETTEDLIMKARLKSEPSADPKSTAVVLKSSEINSTPISRRFDWVWRDDPIELGDADGEVKREVAGH